MLGFEIDDSPDNPAWDAFVARSPDAHLEQTTPWAGLKISQGWRAYRILVRDQGRLVGGAQVLHRPVKKLATVAFISSGPIAESADAYTQVTQQVIAGLKRAAHSYQVVLPPYNWTNVVPVLAANGFFPKPNALPPSNLVTATLMIDLTQDLDTILAGMGSSTRNSVRRGMKEGIEVMEGGTEDVATFFRLMNQLCLRRGIAPRPASVEECHEIWRRLAPAGLAKLFVSRYQSEDVSAALAFVCGGTMRVWKIGWSGEHAERRPNQVMWWELLKWAKAAGLKVFDFDEILPEHARAIQRGETVDDHYWGVTQFKLGFGGKISMIPDAYYRSFSLPAQAMLQLGGSKLATSPWLLRWASRL
jgi:lipid II:glycine glycyltransferase (peptidoglycan interpeptide bridge formation enzyme)